MNKIQTRSILIIILAAVLVSALFNTRIIIWLVQSLQDYDLFALKKGRDQIYYTAFNFFVELFVFIIVALLNYSWLEKISSIDRFKRFKLLIISVINLMVYFILIPAGKLFHNIYFLNKYDNKQIDFDIQNYLSINISVFLLAILVANLLILMKKMKISEIEKIELIEKKSRAELASLKDQISPHFFFNTLSSLSTIIRNEKKERGLDFIQEMSKTYRYTLASKEDLVSLKEELDFLKSYIFLIRKRFGEKISFTMDIPENAFQSVIPPMSLQLLVENAIQHNVITIESPLTIEIYVENGMICVGNNLQMKESEDGIGLGLENLAGRYNLLAKKDIVIDKDEQSFTVKLPLL